MSAAPSPALSSASPTPLHKPNILLFGTGEYTTGYVNSSTSTSDKPMGVVALTFFDLRKRGFVGAEIVLCGRNGQRAQGIKQHLQDTINKMYKIDCTCSIEPYDPSVKDEPNAYLRVLESGKYTPGDIAVITTPDNTHCQIALECIKRGIHCIIAKPVVQTLEEQWSLIQAAKEYQLLHKHQTPPLQICGEYHKRFDPLYSDASSKISSDSLGKLSYFSAYMSQPKSQLLTFKSWLTGGDATTKAAPSDISYYLNSHHIDFLNLSICSDGKSKPIWVQAIAAKGCANQMMGANSGGGGGGVDIEDTITITVQYEHAPDASSDSSSAASSSSSSATPSSSSPSYGIGVFTSSWIAPRSDVHSQQRFHYLGTRGEINIDQAHRGYTTANDDNSKGHQSVNPLFMRYQPSHTGEFVGQSGYGYKSFEHFVELATGRPYTAAVPHAAISSRASLCTTAILQAARKSLDQDNRKIRIKYNQEQLPMSVDYASHLYKEENGDQW